MNELIVNNRIIREPMLNILQSINRETGFIRTIKKSGNSLMISCPFHSNGQENHPSCGVIATTSTKYPPGTYNCFTCHKKGNIISLINKCYGLQYNDTFASNWLVKNYADEELIEEDEPVIEPIQIKKEPKNTIDDSVLKNFLYGRTPASNYLETQRHISQQVIDYFKVGYDESTNSIVFPVNDINGNLTTITKRSIESHKFNVQASSVKPVYLLDEAIKNNYTQVIVCESQINALTCYTYGYPAIALMGTGSKEQLNILKNSGIRSYILMFDGDDAGRKGAEKFKLSLGLDTLITDIEMPAGKDVNDISKNEFISLLNATIDK